MTDADYADNLLLLANTFAQTEPLLYKLEYTEGGIGSYINTQKIEIIILSRKDPSGLVMRSL